MRCRLATLSASRSRLRANSYRRPDMCDETNRVTRRSFLTGLAGATAATALPWTQSGMAATAASRYADPKNPALPNPGMRLDLRRTALVVIDPQIDFMSPRGASWSIVGESVTEQN